MLRLCAALLLQGALVHGHGHVKIPASRAEACMNGGPNKNCGQVQYEAWSVEGPDRYPDTNPPDGKLGSGGAVRFPELDEQSADRWWKVPAKPGPLKITWKFQANHATLDFRYFITKDGWNPNAPLARSAFESAPFCSIERGGALPPMTDVHDCVLPQKSGYHIVYAVWDVYDTSNSFYNVIDMQFSGGSSPSYPPPPSVPVYPPPSVPVYPPPSVPSNPPPSTPSYPPPPASGGCGTQRWGACTYTKCCASGNTCKEINRWYAQCVPGGSPSPPPPRPQAPPPSWGGSPPQQGGGSGGCSRTISRWGGCLSTPSCCAAGTNCYKQSQWYAQCMKDSDNRAGYPRM